MWLVRNISALGSRTNTTKRTNMYNNKANVIWITGLSAAGKTTLAKLVAIHLRSQCRSVVLLDGDELRAVFGAVAINPRNYGREGRLALAMQYSNLCRLLANQGVTVVIATIALFHEVHAWNRANLPGYFEVFLKVPEGELRRRDPKGIYKRFDEGRLTHVAGLDLPIDEPLNPDCLLEFDPEKSIDELAKSVIRKINQRAKFNWSI